MCELVVSNSTTHFQCHEKRKLRKLLELDGFFFPYSLLCQNRYKRFHIYLGIGYLGSFIHLRRAIICYSLGHSEKLFMLLSSFQTKVKKKKKVSFELFCTQIREFTKEISYFSIASGLS